MSTGLSSEVWSFHTPHRGIEQQSSSLQGLDRASGLAMDEIPWTGTTYLYWVCAVACLHWSGVLKQGFLHSRVGTITVTSNDG